MEITKHLILANHVSAQLEVRLEDCTFLNNSIPSDMSSPVLSFVMTYIVMTNSIVAGSNGTAISLYNSNLNLYDNVRFENNHAKYGGALKVCERSFIFLHNNSYIQFINNTALMGGAIFIQQSCLETALPCAFQPSMPERIPVEEFNQWLEYNFVNNSASIAGDVIYGGTLETCNTIGTYSYHHGNKSFLNFLNIFKEVFNLTTQTGPSNISSYPQGVCFCDTTTSELTPRCQKDLQLLKVYPGEEFTVYAITVGQLNGSTIGTIQSTLEEESSFHQLVVSNGGDYSNQCVPLSFSVLSNKSTATIILKPSIEHNNKHFTVNISVQLSPCPLGFELISTGGQYKCDCSILFQHHLGVLKQTIECDITTKTIHRNAPVWFGCHKSENNSLIIDNSSFCEEQLVSRMCVYYCSSDCPNISISDLDKQCIQGRTGVLCGACKPGLSHILGLSHECRKCSDKKLFIYIPSVLFSGVLTVFLLTVLNLTVTEGTLNGLIFYATFLFTCRKYFFNHNSKHHIIQHRFGKSFWIFIAWLNLDAGFDGCAYDGMTGYQYIWLTFGYVFSLLFLQIVMIILSRKFIFFTRLFGRNVLKVLATLLFLTHSQLMHASFQSIRYAALYVKTQNETRTVYVWSFDGNIPYLGFQHVILFLLAAVCLLFMLFFTLCLLFIQCLQKHNNRWYLRWVERLRPFFEAFTGPCHDDYRFWPGLLHLLRSIIYILSMYFNGYELHYRHWKMLTISMFCVLIMALACIFPHGVYKKWPLNVLEFSYILNLCILCVLLGFYKHPYLPMFASVSLVMVTCVGLLFYHTHQQIKTTKTWSKIIKWMPIHLQRFHKRKSDCKLSEECDPLLPEPLPAVAPYREPLIYDD